MAVVVYQNGVFSGALAGMMFQRVRGSFTPSDYATMVNAADALAQEVVVRNAALSVPVADGNAQLATLCASVAQGVCAGISTVSTTLADYLALANDIAAAIKQGTGKLA